MIKIIAAVGKNLELGKNNGLIWHLPGDLKFFKEQTMNKTVAMGRNTFNSLPKKLPNRQHIVLSDIDNFNKDTQGVNVVYNARDFMMECFKEGERHEMFIIGGASVYRMFIGMADELILTEIDASSEADVYFPEFDKSHFQKEILGEGEDNGIHYTHVRYYNRTKYYSDYFG